MAEHATNYESAMKRKSEDGERNTRAKRNRYISIAWWVIHTRAITVDADLRRLPVMSARGERLRYLATPSPRFEGLLTPTSVTERQAIQATRKPLKLSHLSLSLPSKI
jgi:hypothetical protein